MSNAPQLPGESSGFRGLPGGTGEMPVAEVSPRRGRTSAQAILVVLLMGVSGAAIFGMRHLGARAGMDMTVAEVGFKVEVIDSDEAAQARRFAGSPAFIVDGTDLFSVEGSPGAMACRVYPTPDGPRNVPALADLRQALKRQAATG